MYVSSNILFKQFMLRPNSKTIGILDIGYWSYSLLELDRTLETIFTEKNIETQGEWQVNARVVPRPQIS